MIKNFTDEEKIGFFTDELNFIKDPLKKELAEDILKKTQNYFFYVPASSGGRHHPKYTSGEHGLVLHTKALMWILNYMTEIEQCTFTDNEKDLLFIAGMMHDTMKLGNDENGHTVAEHPLLAADRIKEYKGSKYLTDEEISFIYSAIASHMGQWNCDYNNNEILPKPKSEAEKILHLADYLASRKAIEFNFEGYEDSWKNKVQKERPKKYDKVFKLYEEGKTVNEIASETGKTEDDVIELLIYAYREGKAVNIDDFIHPEYEKMILELVNKDEWDGYKKSLKNQLPNEVSYNEINAVLTKHKIKKEKDKEKKFNNKYVDAYLAGKTFEEMGKEFDVKIMTAENNVLDAAKTDKRIDVDKFIDSTYEPKILEIAQNPEWDKKLRTIKAELPDDVGYLCIKAVLIKHNLM